RSAGRSAGTPRSESRLKGTLTRASLVAHADVAQLVEHHLAKVGVAGSNPVVRSRETPGQGRSEPTLLHVPAVQTASVPLPAGCSPPCAFLWGRRYGLPDFRG